MSPDSPDQPGAPDPDGVHQGGGVGLENPPARDEAGGLEAAPAGDQAGPAEGVERGGSGPQPDGAGEPPVRPDLRGGQEADAGHPGVGAAGPEAPGKIHPEMRTGPLKSVRLRNDDREKNQDAPGGKATGTSQTGARITARDVATALKLTDPKWELRKRIRVAAEAMGTTEETVRYIIDRDPELRAAYGSTGYTGKIKARMPTAPTHTEILDRDEDDLPTPSVPGAKTGVELIQLVDEAERALHLKGLEAIGVNEQTLTKLRRLDGLASSTASFIAIGLEKTHRLYYLAVVDLKTVADQIKERYLDNPEAVSDADRPYYYRNYIDAVKEFGRAYDLFLQGAAVILRIVGQNNGEMPEGGKRKTKLGFSGRSLKQAQKADATP